MKRVVQSGPDAITGEDGTNIVMLFKNMAIYAEDAEVPMAVLNVLDYLAAEARSPETRFDTQDPIPATLQAPVFCVY